MQGRVSSCKTVGRMSSTSTLVPLSALDQLMCFVMAGAVDGEFWVGFLLPLARKLEELMEESLGQSSGHLQMVEEKERL